VTGRAPFAGLLAAVVVLATGCSASRVRHPEMLTHFHAMVDTEDGWQVALYRVPPAVGPEAGDHVGTPVLLAHGTCVNRTNFLLEGSDLAAYLSEQGFDVWLTEYRGDRTSVPPDARTWRRADWDADDIAGLDIPAVLDHIEAETGRARVFWIGHSLGGVLGYIVAQGPRGDDLAGLVAFGSPGAFVHPNDLARLTWRHRRLLPAGQLPTRPLSMLLLPAVRDHPRAYLVHAITHTDNADPRRLMQFVRRGMENTGRGLALQYLTWMDGGHLVSRDGTVDYSEGLAGIQVPTLLFAGRVDHVVPAWTVRYAHDHLGGEDRTLVVLGEGWGTVHDYGHGDLVVGDRALDEVFPRVAQWLRTHAQAAARE
jgi:pimeloyl-ACP methyl ester carboxylesterase